jgi:hypothetical protein
VLERAVRALDVLENVNTAPVLFEARCAVAEALSRANSAAVIFADASATALR